MKIDHAVRINGRSTAILVLVSILAIVAVACLASGQTPPPSTGDWVIRDTTAVSDQVIDLPGSLIVNSSGSLNLSRVNLTLPGEYYGTMGIFVEPGGTLVFDGGTINSSNTLDYYFEVQEDAILRMDNVTVTDLWQSSRTEVVEIRGGIYILSDDVVIRNCTITDNERVGMVIRGDPMIVDCTFQRTKYYTASKMGGVVTRDAYAIFVWEGLPRIWNCTFRDNGDYATAYEDAIAGRNWCYLNLLGHGIFVNHGSAEIRNCTFTGTGTIADGGLMYVYVPSVGRWVTFRYYEVNTRACIRADYPGALNITGCTFTENFRGSIFGQSRAYGIQHSGYSSRVTNNTFFENGGGGVFLWNAEMELRDNVFLDFIHSAINVAYWSKLKAYNNTINGTGGSRETGYEIGLRVDILNGTVEMHGLNISNCGWGMMITDSDVVKVYDVLITDCDVKLYVTGSTVYCYNVSITAAEVDLGTRSSNVYLFFNLGAMVTWQRGTPIEGARVNITNGTGGTLLSQTTNRNGTISPAWLLSTRIVGTATVFNVVNNTNLSAVASVGGLTSDVLNFTFRTNRNITILMYDLVTPKNPDRAWLNNDTIPSDVWQNQDNYAKFYWSGAEDQDSGLAGYYVYFGPDPEFDELPGMFVTLNESFWGTWVDCVMYLKVAAVDIAWNIAELELYYVYKHDWTPPINPDSATQLKGSTESDVWQNATDDPMFTWPGASDKHSGVDGYRVYFGEDPKGISDDYVIILPWNAGEVPDGTYYLRVSTRDAAGNQAVWTTLYVFRFDATVPGEMTAEAKLMFKVGLFSGYEVYYNWSVPWDLSGIETYEWRVDDGEVTRTTSNGIITHPPPDGYHILYVRAWDMAGNVRDWLQVNFTVDTTPPEGTVLINGGDDYTTGTTVWLTINATDEISGVSVMRFSDDGDSWSEWIPYNMTMEYDLPPGDGEKTVHVQFRDHANRYYSNPMSDSILLDTTEPTGTLEINDGDAFTSSRVVSLSINATDANGVISWRLSIDDGEWTEWAGLVAMLPLHLPPGDGNRSVGIQLRDAAGLVSTTPIVDDIIVDTTSPVADAGEDRRVILDTTVSLDGSGSTDEWPLAHIEWYFEYDGLGQELEGSVIAWSFEIEGVYEVTLRVRDAAGNWGTDTTVVTVIPKAMVCILGPFLDPKEIPVNGAEVNVKLNGTDYSGVTLTDGWATIVVNTQDLVSPAEVQATKDGWEPLEFSIELDENGTFLESPPVMRREQSTEMGVSSGIWAVAIALVAVVVVVVVWAIRNRPAEP